MHSEILKPVVVLIAWTLVMFVWMMAVRLPAMKAAGIDMTKLKGGKGSDADGVLPPQAQWKAHNYNHLFEQPTCFYAVSFMIAFTGTGDGITFGRNGPLLAVWGENLMKFAPVLGDALAAAAVDGSTPSVRDLVEA